jgi:hypothetical protein
MSQPVLLSSTGVGRLPTSSDASPLCRSKCTSLSTSLDPVETAWAMLGSWVGRHYPDIGLFGRPAAAGGFMLGHSPCGPGDLLH